jgi:hypothetical protein
MVTGCTLLDSVSAVGSTGSRWRRPVRCRKTSAPGILACFFTGTATPKAQRVRSALRLAQKAENGRPLIGAKGNLQLNFTHNTTICTIWFPVDQYQASSQPPDPQRCRLQRRLHRSQRTSHVQTPHIIAVLASGTITHHLQRRKALRAEATQTVLTTTTVRQTRRELSAPPTWKPECSGPETPSRQPVERT